MELPTDFVDLMEEFYQSQPKQEAFRLGKVDSSYTSGLPKVLFDGDDVASDKLYAHNAGYTPVADDRILLARVGNTYVILCKIKNS